MNFNIDQLGNISNNYNSKILLNLENIGAGKYWLKEISLPTISIETEDVQSVYDPITLPGNIISYGSEIPATFFLDEYFNVYRYIYNWIHSFKPGSTYVGKANSSLFILDNNMKRVVVNVNFSGFYPISMGALTYNNYGVTEQSFEVIFKYDSWTPGFRT